MDATEDGPQAGPSSGPAFLGARPPWQRFSTSQIPSVPAASYLRSALLGYLTEVEATVRARLAGVAGPPDGHGLDHDHLYPSSPDADCTGSTSDTEPRGLSPESAEDYFSTSATALAGREDKHGQGSSIRRRGRSGVSMTKDQSQEIGTLPVQENGEHADAAEQQGILPYLSSLRQDVLAHLPSLPPLSSSAAQSTTAASEWLKSLPHRLSLVEDSIVRPSTWSDGAAFKAPPFAADIGIPASVQGARERVIRLVHAMLPSEEWEGWERLGWEDTAFADETSRKAQARHARRASLQGRRRPATGSGEDDSEEDEEDEEDEPEYLFPNRTPASANAVAFRRRLIRSKSLGAVDGAAAAAGRPSPWRAGESDASSLPMLQRQKSHPVTSARERHPLLGSEKRIFDQYGGVDQAEADGDDGDEDDTDETVEEIAAEPEALDTKLSKLVAPSGHIGPTIAEALQLSANGTKLITYDDLPFVWRNNEHIITGYRFIPLDSARGPVPLIKSAFAWHNETVNIFSHFLPTLFILAVIPLIIFYASPLPDPHPLDTSVLIMYLLAAIACLTSSASWHVISGCASRHWFEWGACVDYVGISWLIAASFGTVVYNAYYCHPKTVLFYGSVNIACGALGSILPFQEWFNKRKYKNYRIGFFLFLNFAMFAPMVQIFWQHGYEKAAAFVSPFGLSICAYVVGLIFYATHFPECIWPGKFDTWGASHQLWHVAIVIAIGLHYRAVFVAHSARYAYSCMATDAGTPIGELVEGWWHAIFG